MHLPNKQDDSITAIAKRMRGLIKELVQDLPASDGDIVIDPATDIFAGRPNTQLFLIKSGQVHCQRGQKLIYIAEEGDLVGLSRSLQLPEGPLVSNDRVELIPYHRDTLVSHVNTSDALQKHWAFYLLCRGSFFAECLAQEMSSEFKPATGFLNFDTGDIIIQQGEQADCVYTMLEGSAEAFRDDVKVGDIKTEEIFGAMAVFTKQTRGATVKATSPCSVLAVKKEDFLDLVSYQPQVCVSLIEEMADKINQLNQQVSILQK